MPSSHIQVFNFALRSCLVCLLKIRSWLQGKGSSFDWKFRVTINQTITLLLGQYQNHVKTTLNLQDAFQGKHIKVWGS